MSPHLACFNLMSVIEEWDTLEIKNAWPAEELSFSIALAVLYAVLAVFSIVSLVYAIYYAIAHNNRTKTVSDFFALLFLMVLTIRVFSCSNLFNSFSSYHLLQWCAAWSLGRRSWLKNCIRRSPSVAVLGSCNPHWYLKIFGVL